MTRHALKPLLFLGLTFALPVVSAPFRAEAFNPTCNEKGKAIEVGLITPDMNQPGAEKPIELVVPTPYLPIPANQYARTTASLILRASWPEMGPACLDVEHFTYEPGQDPTAIMQGHFDRLITLQISGMTSQSPEETLRALLAQNPHNHGQSADGGLTIYGRHPDPDVQSLDQPKAVPAPPSPPSFPGFADMENSEVLVPVEPDETPLLWMLCVKLPIPMASEQCQARLRVDERVQAEMTFSRTLLPDWRLAMDKTSAVIKGFMLAADSEPL